MALRPLMASALAASLIAAVPALAEDAWIVSPALTESSKTAQPAPSLSLNNSPFYSDITYSGTRIETAADSRWYLTDGADTAYDADPRDTMVLPRPVPGITFELR